MKQFGIKALMLVVMKMIKYVSCAISCAVCALFKIVNNGNAAVEKG